jgi:Concanavalin A-like lectin/glucanases superfamily
MFFTPPPIWRSTAAAAIGPKSFVLNGTNQWLNKTLPTTTPVRVAFSISMWLKPNSLAAQFDPFECVVGTGTVNDMLFIWTPTGPQFQWTSRISTTIQRGDSVNPFALTVGAWTHIIVAVNTTLSNTATRVRVYRDGVEQTDAATAGGDPAQNEQQGFMLSGAVLSLGGLADGSGGRNLNGKLAFIQIIDGAQVVPTDIGQLVGAVWSHKKFAGSFGATGIYLAGTTGFTCEVPGAVGTFVGNNMTLANLDPNDLPPFVNF